MERRTIALWAATCCLILHLAAGLSTTDSTTWNQTTENDTAESTPSTTPEEGCDVTPSWTLNTTTLKVTWSGRLDENSNVTVTVDRLCYGNLTCNATTSKLTTSFREGTVLFRLDPDEVYEVKATFDCFVPNGSWTIPVPAGAPNLRVDAQTDTRVLLAWDPFLDPRRGRPLLYVVTEEGGPEYRTNETSYEVRDLEPYAEYTFRMYAEFEGRPQPDWDQSVTARTDAGVPHAPTSLNATLVTDTTVELTWESPAASTGPLLGYRVRWNDESGAGSEGRRNGSHTTPYRVEGLKPYRRYTFAVSAETAAGPGNWSEELKLRTEVGVPHLPTGLTAISVTDTTVRLTWEAPVPSTGPVLKYRIRWNDESGTRSQERLTRSNDTQDDVTGLLPYERYTFDVAAETEAGPGNWSEELPVRTRVGVPHPPTGLAATSVTNTTVNLTWEAPAISTGPILKYRIRWEEEFAAGSQERRTGSNATRDQVDGLTPYRWYTWAVSAETEAGHGNWSEGLKLRTAVGVPHAPTALQTTSVTNTTVGLTWQAPAISTGPVLGYRIRWKEMSGTRSQEVPTQSNATRYQVHGLTPYEWYTFSVAAETEAGPSNWSEELPVRTRVGVPHAPTALNTTSMTDTTVELTWESPALSTGPILGYRIRWNDESGAGSQERRTGSNSTIYEVEELTPYRRYTFAVSAETEAGRGNWSEELKLRTEVGVPHAPTALNTTSVTNTTVELTWEAPALSTGPILKYRIRWNDESGAGSQERRTGSNATGYEVDGLTPYRWYTIAVSAETEAGPGNWSEELKLRTEVGVPYAPTALNATSVTNTTVGLTWEAPGPSTGPVLGYRIRWNDESGPGSEKRRNGTNSTGYEVKGLTPYEWYTFAVSAETEAGRGNWSETLSLRTEVGVPSVPREYRMERKTDSSFQISWTRPQFLRSPEVLYVVGWRTDAQTEDSETEIRGEEGADKQTIRYTVADLLPYTNYSVRVSATNGAGRGPATGAVRAQTEIGVPRPALIRSVSILGQRTARVVWTTEGPFPGPVQFSVQAWKQPDNCSDRVSSVMDREVKGREGGAAEWSMARPTAVNGLTPYALYSFVVLLRTDATDGVESHKSEGLRMPPDAPGPPQKVVVDCRRNSTQARVSWNPPFNPNGQIVRYRVRYGIVGESESVRSWAVDASEVCDRQSHVISGMRPERRYRFTVTASVEGVSEEGAAGRPRGFCELPAGIPSLGNVSRLWASSWTPRRVTLEWTGDTFSDYMGEIVRYSLLVGKQKALGESAGGQTSEDAPTWSNFSVGGSDFYQATPNGWNPFGTTGDDPLKCQNEMIEEEGNRTLLRCTVGAEWPCPENETYCNGPLEPDTPYELKIRGFTRGGYNETQLLHVRTGPVPKKSGSSAWVAGVVTLVLLGALAVGGYVMHRKGILESTVSAAWSKLWHSKESSSDSGESGQEMQRNRNSRPVPTRLFSEHVRRMMSDSHLQFSQEFEELKIASPLLPCTVAESEENRPKNRWMNIFPFDHSRVKLLPLCDDPGSDFINASYIPGPCSPREYIASQGPLPHTVDDFWRLVWEQSVSTVVMLTQCTERGKRKCEMYWPEPGEARHYGDLSVATVSESMLATHVIRVLRLQLGSYDRRVKQIHFMHWPDFGCPDRPEDLIEFVGAVRDHLPRRNPGPILVHCSAGVGRTGTFIAVDRLRRQPGEEVDVYGTVLELRHHRTNMVQTEDQYIYIHLCVEQLIGPGDPQTTTATENIYCNVAELDTSF